MYNLSPYRRLASMREAMDRMFEEGAERGPAQREMLLSIDVIGNEEAYILKALVPGISEDDLDIEVVNNSVSIRGEFASDLPEGSKYLNCELPEGRFSRVINLPEDVDASQTEATLKNGVLTLRVPKAEEHKPRTIKVSTK